MITKGLISFEWLFYYEDVQRAKILDVQKKISKELEVEPKKYIKIGSKCIEEERLKLLKLYHQFLGVITWIYDDLKTYDKEVIHHTIELMPNVKPYR